MSKTMIALAVAVLVTFAGGLYFIAHNKPAVSPALPHPSTGKGNGLPPKPEERWRYIKELENRQMGVTTPTEPSSGGAIQSPTQLTDEQRQLLEQMQSDMRRQPTPLSEVPYNDQMRPQAQTITPPPARAPAAAPKQEAARQPEAAKEKTQRWMVQCGSFKSMEPAESIRAQLAFAGIESRITSNGGWNRIMLGPYNNRADADKMLQRLKANGASGCIPLAAGG